MQLLDSRRLTGPNLLLDRPGAVIEVSLSPEEVERAVAAWRTQARRILDAVGWTKEETEARVFPGGASLAISAPIDGLYAATEVNEWAWAAAEAGFEEGVFRQGIERLREEITREANPALLALRDAAAARNVAFLSDDSHASVGIGMGSLTWPVDELPDPGEVDWTAVYDVPVLLVTGTNGKTTTVRLLASMFEAASQVVGLTSTDRIEVGGEVLERGDFSGPGGARTLLRDRRVEVAVLETARGGLLRRGLSVDRAAAALVTNIAADHLGEFGVNDLSSLTAAKLIVTRAVGPEGRVVLNADDSELVAAADAIAAPITWFSLDAREGSSVYLESGFLVLVQGDEQTRIVHVEEVPITFGGAARHNVANALGAIAMAAAVGLPSEAMAEGLRRVGGTPEDNPGRANLFERDGVRILVDYAHNPHGLTALLDIARTLPAERRLLLIGQAGDRDDEAIRDLARAAWAFLPDHVVVKELTEMLRGRGLGEVPALLVDEFLRLGAQKESVTRADSELEAVEEALAWARPGDLLVLLVHTQREAVLERIQAEPSA